MLQGPCPSCNTENFTYFGDIFTVKGNRVENTVDCRECKAKLTFKAEERSVRAEHSPLRKRALRCFCCGFFFKHAGRSALCMRLPCGYLPFAQVALPARPDCAGYAPGCADRCDRGTRRGAPKQVHTQDGQRLTAAPRAAVCSARPRSLGGLST